MTLTPSHVKLKELAEKAQRALKGTEVWSYAAISRFREAATPEAILSLLKDQEEARAKIAYLDAAVISERERCLDIVSAARFGEVDQDFRAIYHMISGGLTVKEIING